MPINVNFSHKGETNTCHIFRSRVGNEFITLYLKKTQLEEAKIDPNKGLTVTIVQKELTE